MTKHLFLLLICTGISCYSQQSHSGIVVSTDSMETLEFVSVFNGKDHTLTNEDGRFQFSSQLDSVFFYSPGYEKLKTSFSTLRDTIYLQKNSVNLDEVIVTNAKTILQRIKDSIASNYLLTPHTETFFIRALLRRNDTIVRLQDMKGRVKRKTSVYTGDLELDKKDYQVELQQMRQVGIKKDKNNVYFIFPSFFRIFSEFVRINAMGPGFEVLEKPAKNKDEIRVEFTSEKDNDGNLGYGHYILNQKDNAIRYVAINTIHPLPKSLKNKKDYDHTLNFQRNIFFTKDISNKKYYISSAKQKATITTKAKEQKIPTTFQIEIILYTTDPFGMADVKSNVNEQKDVFKLKFPYNETFWQSQNQLLLTDKMLEFLSKLDNENTEFKIRSNLD
ncbi:MAG: hypothetical protein ACJA1P_001118 [Maribacter sp.]|jgi:hypothetical protein